jgi:hypothetical protein
LNLPGERTEYKENKIIIDRTEMKWSKADVGRHPLDGLNTEEYSKYRSRRKIDL